MAWAKGNTLSMTPFTHRLRNFIPLIYTLLTLLCDGLRFLFLCLRPSPTLAAENLFLRKQLALYQERQVKPHRPTQATRMALTWLAPSAPLAGRLRAALGPLATRYHLGR